MKKLCNDDDFVYFKGGKITRTESKRVMLALGFGVLGIALTFLVGANSSPGGKGIMFVFTVAGYLVGVKVFPKSTR
jgi:hypothetical protein